MQLRNIGIYIRNIIEQTVRIIRVITSAYVLHFKSCPELFLQFGRRYQAGGVTALPSCLRTGLGCRLRSHGTPVHPDNRTLHLKKKGLEKR